MWADAFRRLALIGAVLAAVVVVMGAWVRLTDAGLGCPDWPGCYGHLYPHPDHQIVKAWHEMIHRYVATTLGVIITGLLGWAWFERKEQGRPLTPVALLFLVVCLQGALGALTVTLKLRPLIVTAHLLGGLATLSLLSWLSMTPERRTLSSPERRLRPAALAASLVLLLQIFLGGWTSTNYAAVACPDFPTCQRSWWPPMDFRDAFVLWHGLGSDRGIGGMTPIDEVGGGTAHEETLGDSYEGGVLANPARMAIHFMHRLGAVLAGTVLIALGISTMIHGRSRRLSAAGLVVVAAVLLQVSIGIATVHFGVPLPLATLHNAGAALLVISMARLLRALWPAPPAGMVPLARGDRTE